MNQPLKSSACDPNDCNVDTTIRRFRSLARWNEVEAGEDGENKRRIVFLNG